MRRTQPWIWTFALLVALFVAASIDAPTGGREVTVGLPDLIPPFAIYLLPATMVVGVLFGYIPPHHRILRTALLVPLALYVAGVGALWIFSLPTQASIVDGIPASVSTGGRIIGFVAEASVWFAGRVVEEVMVAIRQSRQRP